MSPIGSDTLGLSGSPRFVRGGFGGAARAAFAAGGRAATAAADPPGVPFRRIVAFGDSLSDAGNDFILSLNRLPVSPPYVDGHFTNGAVWVQDLAAWTGLPAVHASLSGGTDYAYGGAETGNEPLHSAGFLDLPSQMQQFRFLHHHASASTLYTISAGSNDVMDAVSAWSTDPNTAAADVAAAVGNITSFVFGLASMGARNVLVMDVPDLGKTPAEMSGGPTQAAVASSLSWQFDAYLNQTMQQVAAQAHMNIHTVDTYSLIDTAVANPSWFGLTNVTDPVWTGNYLDPNSGTLTTTDPVAQNQHLFWDSLHPTAYSHAVLGAAAHTSLFGG